VHGSAPHKKTALLRDPLLEVIDRIDTTTTVGLRDRALLLLGFAVGLRRSELVALAIEDLSPSPDGVRIRIARSKTDQQGRGQGAPSRLRRGAAAVPGPRSARLDRHGRAHHRPAFRRVTRTGAVSSPLTAQSVALIIKKRASAAGLDPREFAGHQGQGGARAVGRRSRPATDRAGDRAARYPRAVPCDPARARRLQHGAQSRRAAPAAPWPSEPDRTACPTAPSVPGTTHVTLDELMVILCAAVGFSDTEHLYTLGFAIPQWPDWMGVPEQFCSGSRSGRGRVFCRPEPALRGAGTSKTVSAANTLTSSETDSTYSRSASLSR
jgi:hypothetical protein